MHSGYCITSIQLVTTESTLERRNRGKHFFYCAQPCKPLTSSRLRLHKHPPLSARVYHAELSSAQIPSCHSTDSVDISHFASTRIPTSRLSLRRLARGNKKSALGNRHTYGRRGSAPVKINDRRKRAWPCSLDWISARPCRCEYGITIRQLRFYPLPTCMCFAVFAAYHFTRASCMG